MQTNCSIPECPTPALIRGWCNLHYRRWQRQGDPLITRQAIPREPMPVEMIPPDFGHWLAGLVDGEGCFVLNLHKRRHWKSAIRPQFQLNLRIDDAPILLEVVARLGIGSVSYQRLDNHSHMASWRVGSLTGCVALIDFFDRFPLRSRKASDYPIWREAVLERAQGRRKIHDLNLRSVADGADAERLFALKAQLEAGRKIASETAL